MLPDCRLTTADSENFSICNPTTFCESCNLPIFQFGTSVSYDGSWTSSSGNVCSMLGATAGCAGAAAGARFGALRRRAAVRVELRRGAARFALRFALRLARLADRFAVLLRDAVFLEALRDLAAVFAAFRRFLAMRAPPVE